MREKKKEPRGATLRLFIQGESPSKNFIFPQSLLALSLAWQHKRIQGVHGGALSCMRILHQRTI